MEKTTLPSPTVLGHPTGLFLLFGTELWERFSFYAMRAILVLYLVDKTRSDGGFGLGWQQDNALQLYALFTGFFYLTPLLGGWLADNFLGQRKAIYIGGSLMALGQFSLAFPHPWASGYELLLFYIGLAGLVLGNGLFKPNISTMVGDLYAANDKRRDSAFTLFYMGINLGAFLSAITVGTVVRFSDGNYQMGFLCAGLGMLLSLIIHRMFAHKLLGDIGTVPAALRHQGDGNSAEQSRYQPLTSIERDRIRVIIVMGVFTTVFWAGFEQAGGLFNLFAHHFTDRVLLGWEIPTEWFQSLNALFIILFAPVVASIWLRCGVHEPSSPIKFAIGLVCLALGFLFMVGATVNLGADTTVKASMMWLVAAYFFHTIGELCLSPIGLSMVSKLAPLRLLSLMMGTWFVFTFLGNYIAGMVGSLIGSSSSDQQLNNAMAIFAGIGSCALVAAAVLYLLADRLVDWMHGAEHTLHPKREQERLEQEISVIGEHDAMRR